VAEKGDAKETPKVRLARPRRTDDELQYFVTRARGLAYSGPVSVPLSADLERHFEVASKITHRSTSAVGPHRYKRDDLLFVADTFWPTLYLLEDERPVERHIRLGLRQQRERLRVAWERLRGLNTATGARLFTSTSLYELDCLERKLAVEVANSERWVSIYEQAVEWAQRIGKRDIDARRARAVCELRTHLKGWTWAQIAELIVASATLSPAPCPTFVIEGPEPGGARRRNQTRRNQTRERWADDPEDPQRLERWLKTRVRDRRA
jgi:hypothetical protein